MQTHPDAYAFMRNYLEQPADAVTRLVFADWLEETGEPRNVAWAHYIRLKIEADRHNPGSRERRELDRRADAFAPDIRARLTISAKLFVRYPRSLLQLLPAPNITVRLAGFEVPRELRELEPESLARENFVLPLSADRRTRFYATVDPRNSGIAQRLSFFHRCDIVLVGTHDEELIDSINRTFAYPEAQYADTALLDHVLADLLREFETVPGTYPVQNASDFVDDVLHACARRGADVITFTPHGELVRVYYRTPSGVVEAGRISRGDWTHLVFPEIVRRGEASGTEFTVEVVRNGAGERAVRIWPTTFMLL